MHGYTSGHVNSQTVMEAFCSGSGIPLRHVKDGLQDGGAAMYGNARGLKPLLDQCISERRPWVYLDNGYLNAGHWEGYFRVTKNAYMHNGTGHAKPDRWAALGRVIMPWKKGGDFVLVCPPGPVYASLRGFDATAWLNNTLAILQNSTGREIRVRAKPSKATQPEPLAQALRGCHAVVTHSSNSAVDALLAGVPVFCTDACTASSMGVASLHRIESPHYPTDRERFFATLAANQWTLSEMKRGICWKELNG